MDSETEAAPVPPTPAAETPPDKVETFVKFDGPDKRGMLASTVALLQALADAAGESMELGPMLLRPDRVVSPGVSVSDEGYRFVETEAGVEVFSPDGQSLAVSDQRGAEVAAAAHYMKAVP